MSLLDLSLAMCNLWSNFKDNFKTVLRQDNIKDNNYCKTFESGFVNYLISIRLIIF
jgi:hypothetical protein